MINQQEFLTTIGFVEESVANEVSEFTSSTNSAYSDVANTPFSVADNAALDVNGSDFSIAMWINVDSFVSGRVTSLFAKGSDQTDAASHSYMAILGGAGVNQVQFYVSDSATSTPLQHSDTLSADTWYFVVCTYTNSSKEMAISINDGTPQTTTHTGVDVADNNSSFLPGGGSSHDALLGRMDLMGVWKKVLSASEITSLYNDGNGKVYDDLTSGEKTSLSAYWNFDESSDGSTPVNRADSHSNNLTATDVNTTPSGDPVPN